MKRNRDEGRTGLRRLSMLALATLGTVIGFQPPSVRAQNNPKLVIDEDCQAFDISADNAIVFAVPRLKRVRQLIIERDDISIATGPGKTKRIVDGEKFMPFPPPAGYVVDSLVWSPNGRRIVVNMSLQKAPPGFTDKDAKKRGDLGEDNDQQPLASVTGGKAIALLDEEGREIKVANSKTRFIQDAVRGTWLRDDANVVYQTGGGPSAIARVRPEDGKVDTLFEGHTFNAIVWDAKRNRAFAIGENLGLRRGLTLVALDLLREVVTEVAHIENYQGALSLSPSGTKIAFFEDGDFIDVIDTEHPSKSARVRAGYGRFEWGRDEQRVLLKRGPIDRSNILLWVGLYDESFSSILHGLQFHDFQIAPSEDSIAVTDPGKRVLRLYSLP
ncbi:MAG TPA: hypothetical protein VEJ45_04755 [Candidatus Acidoferrales bacterium]|nr:hypothetical protein [Candidatus Acidoferrales bacterium]